MVYYYLYIGLFKRLYFCGRTVIKTEIRIFQKGFNFSQDGPGNRLVYHLQGCNMRCPWCSNPEGIAPDGSVMKQNGKEQCCCVTVDTADVLDEIRRSAMMFFDGGGVTFTGGEATIQFNALRELFGALKKEGINTALETNGSCARLSELFGLIDFLIIDLKHYDSNRHKEVIGCGNETVVENIRLAASKRSQLLVRIPLINGFNASEDDALGFVRVLLPLAGTACKVEVLRYHEYGKDKWARCGMTYTVENAAVGDAQFKAFCKILSDNGIEMIRT